MFVSKRGNCRLGDYGFVTRLTAQDPDLYGGPGTEGFAAPEASSLIF